MDEEEELENTLIGQEEEAPAVNTGDALMGAGQSMFTADTNVVAAVPGIENIRNPGAFETANVEPVEPAGPPTTVGESIRQTYDESVLADLIGRGFGQEAFQSQAPDGTPTFSIFNKRFGTLGSQVPYSEASPEAKAQAMRFMLETGGIERPLPETPTSPVRTAEQVQSILNEQRATESVQSPTETSQIPAGVSALKETQFPSPNTLSLPSESVGQIPSVNAFSAENAARLNPMMQAQSLEATQGGATAAPPSQTLSQFMRNEDAPEQRTEQFVDPQGRLRRRLTPGASALQGFAPGVQPLAPEYTGFEQASADLQDRLRDQQTRPGESQADRDTRVAQSRTTGGQTGGLSFDDARRRAEGQLAARGVRNPSASQVNALARSIQAAEPERLEALKTQRAINEARLKTAQATLDRPEFEGKVYTVNGVTFAQTSRGGAQVIDTGAETPEQSTAQIQNFEFTLDQIDKAREAYSAGDVDRANDILTAAGIQKNGIDVTANEYFGDLNSQVTPAVPTPQATDSGFTPKQEAGIQRVMADNKITREEAVKALKESGQLK